MSNLLSYIVLFSFPFLAVILFNRLGATKGIIWTILAGYLFLPVRPVIDLPVPGLPYIDKTFVPALCALILVGVAQRRELRLAAIARRRAGSEGQQSPDGAETPAERSRGWWLVNLLVFVAIAGPVVTTLTNAEPLFRGVRTQAGFQLYDAGRAVVTALVMLMPFFLARKYLSTVEAHRAIIWAFVVAVLVYMLLSLYEVRMAPTLNRKLYGFFAHDWRQHIRRGGYRPILFTEHGLRVAIFLAMGIIATAVSARLPEQAKRKTWLLLGLIPLFIVFWMTKSLGSFMIACVFVPIALFVPMRTQVLVSAVFALVILLYPMLRGAGWIPVDRIVSFAASVEEQRAESMQFRLENEDILLERAALKPLAGWGGQGRWLVFDERGEKESIPDGRWVITIGQYGWLGYLSEFGLLTLSILAIAWRRKTLEIGVATGGLVLILTANLIDLIPNSGLTPLTWLVAGALTGWYERQRAAKAVPERASKTRQPMMERKSLAATRTRRI
ncbi:hypothetical protein SAMN05421762_3854 [Pseudooceanicola nitratireducens]|jgi:hypothetical protein|uniref:O-Antigen ligase n=1 Tax=Pseudooceanicola nitratireducens TaxID=517719 RepID=A0A1I1QZR6_9RHOB|nr:hypothetical protein [Pseudooceanicola nitratireducens]SEJ78125.1 hypothetical protein SAMN05216183_10934 [Pseudooceanicola nitratireducens]SFD27616.1 hypothetical protein SAMN05421762_3854 [Pseudooceanicola nitratireducens]